MNLFYIGFFEFFIISEVIYLIIDASSKLILCGLLLNAKMNSHFSCEHLCCPMFNNMEPKEYMSCKLFEINVRIIKKEPLIYRMMHIKIFFNGKNSSENNQINITNINK